MHKHAMAVITLTAMAAAPRSAAAVDVGTTFSMSLANGSGSGTRGVVDLPSFDLYFGESLRLRIGALHTLESLFNDANSPYLGADLWAPAVRQQFSGSWEAIVGVGGSLDLSFGDPAVFILGAIAPIGFEIGEDARFGAYIEPTFYVAAAAGEVIPGVGATALVAIWF